MLNIDLQELKDKGSIILLGNGSILKAINDELVKVLDNIEDERTESNKKRKIKIEFTIEPNSSRDCIDLSCDVNAALAPKNVLGVKMALTKDELNAYYSMKEQTGQADGQMDIDGIECIPEAVVIELPYNSDDVEDDMQDDENIAINEDAVEVIDAEVDDGIEDTDDEPDVDEDTGEVDF